MIHSDLLNYMLLFLVFVFIGAAVINGIFFTTRGETETDPDGVVRDHNDMIFYFFYKWVMKKKGEQYIYYTGDQLRVLYEELINVYKYNRATLQDDHIQVSPSFEDAVNEALGHLPTTPRNMDNDANGIRWENSARRQFSHQGIKVSRSALSDGNLLKFYKVVPVYRYGKFIRKPLVECLKCMSSFWGTVIWWPVVLAFFPFSWWLVAGWIAYLFSLSYFNTLLFYKAK